MPDPFAAMKQVAALKREVMRILHYGEFFETNELNYDMSNWWAPNEKALLVLYRAAGFKRVGIITVAPL